MPVTRVSLILWALFLLPESAVAGLNSAATAQIYWQVGSTGAGRPSQDDTTSTPQLVITASGVNNIMGADVQIHYWSLRLDRAMPPAWQFQSGGCAEGAAQFHVGGRGGFYPNIFSSIPAVSGLATVQNQAQFATGDCLTPHNSGLLWLSTLGAVGRDRNPLSEYAVWAVSFDLRPPSSGGGANCAGGPADPRGPVGICLHPDHRVPCNDPPREGVIELFDGNSEVDIIPFAGGRSVLTWNSGNSGALCGSETPARRTTWGTLKRMFR